jgi:glutathione S-transferase
MGDMAAPVEYELFYWPGIQGRGEFVRLAFEDAGVPYDDVGRRSESEGGGVPAIERLLEEPGRHLTPLGPPFLRHGDVVVAQTAAILQYVGPRIGVVPPDEGSCLRAHQIQLTMADLVAEVHQVHHPIAVSLYYEDQKDEAARCARAFVHGRIPKFFTYFDRALDSNPAGAGKWLVGDECSYVDLSLFQIMAGLRYAFPRAMRKHERRYPRLGAVHDAVAARPRLAAYLASSRRIPFNEDGIFRHYPELDLPSRAAAPSGHRAPAAKANPRRKGARRTSPAAKVGSGKRGADRRRPARQGGSRWK